jgi:hypothetical protein
MTNKELADKLEAESERLFEAAGGTKISDGKQHGIVLGLSVAAEYYRSLPDPTQAREMAKALNEMADHIENTYGG